MTRSWVRFARASCLVVLTILLTALPAQAKNTLRFGTLAPRNSTWGKVFDSFKKAMEKKAQRGFELRIYYNGVLGSEETMAAKLRSGQLDGATLSALGLAHIDKRVMVMTLPWLVDSWDKLDRVRPELAPEFETEFDRQGLQILGWGDIGLVYGFTRGYSIHLPQDMRGHRVMVLRGEPVGSLFFENVRGTNPIPADPMDILNLLRTSQVDTISAPALIAEQLQWIPYLDHVSSQPLACAIGASVARKDAMAALPADTRNLFVSLAQRVGKIQGTRIRRLDEEAYFRIKRRMTVVSVTDTERKEWETIVRIVLKRLGNGVYPRPMMEKVARLTGHKLEW
jgi:TRAP-type C4-dicarboxylate transport system substrate-binding protein